jgi:hypothetical protein
VRRLLAAPLLAVCLFAADTTIELPVIGHVFDPQARAVRAILGIPGATRMSAPISIGDNTAENVWIAPGKAYALSVVSDGTVLRIDLTNGAASQISSDVLDFIRPTEVVWSPTGSSAALRSAGGRTRVLRNIGSSPEAAMDTLSAGDAINIAVSDDGGQLLAIRRTLQGTTLTALRAEGDERLLLTAPGLSVAAFFNGTRDAVVADSVEGKVYLLRNSASLSLLTQSQETLALAATADNSRVLIMGKQTGRLSIVRVANSESTPFECSCSMDVLDRLQGGVFRVSRGTDGPVWLFDPDSAANPFTFVPQAEQTNE